MFPCKLLIVAAHPDDEVLMAGGVLSKNKKLGGENYIIFLTNGVSSRDKESDYQAIEIRYSESLSACEIFNANVLLRADLPDNQLDSIPLLKIIKLIEEKINKLNPDLIITHSQDELNIDHRIVNQALVTACRPIGKNKKITILFANVPSSTEWHFNPYKLKQNFYVDITEYCDLKYKAMECYLSENRLSPNPRSLELIKIRDRLIGAEVGLNCAESFFVFRLTIT